MSTRKVTEDRARQIILSQCRQFVEDTPAAEPGHEWDIRVEHLAKHLDSETGADISEKATGAIRELLATLEELQSVELGTHWRIVINRDLTIDNRPDLRDELTHRTLRDHMYALLQESAFTPARHAA
ncbi:hypothetical protein [Pseudarthrobacter sp. S9]|uniref:hypothetical protein n=1 Tax=Pseudarthrobacter sp. S9 TaxID=3418421 RepID=UPI003CFF3711